MDTAREEHSSEYQHLLDVIVNSNLYLHNISVYPEDHPNVKNAQVQVFESLRRLLHSRPEVKIVMAKDILVINDQAVGLDTPACAEFVSNLLKLNITWVSFTAGLTMEEFSEFFSLLSESLTNSTEEEIERIFIEKRFQNITIGVMDYDLFVFLENQTEDLEKKISLWERYINGLMNGTLDPDTDPNSLHRIPPSILADLFNDLDIHSLEGESIQRIGTALFSGQSEGNLQEDALSHLAGFFKSVRPDLKEKLVVMGKEMLLEHGSSPRKEESESNELISSKLLGELLDSFNVVGSQVLDENLLHVVDSIGRVEKQDIIAVENVEGDMLVDDFYLSSETIEAFAKRNHEEFVTESYNNEIEQLKRFRAPGENGRDTEILRDQLREIDMIVPFSHCLAALFISGISSKEERGSLISVLPQQCTELTRDGRFEDLLSILAPLNAKQDVEGEDPARPMLDALFTEELVGSIIESFKKHQSTSKALIDETIEQFGRYLMPGLFVALIEENKRETRKFLIEVILVDKSSAFQEVFKYLDDERWYVRRNMLQILIEVGQGMGIQQVRGLCEDAHEKVRIKAMQYLLLHRDPHAVNVLKGYLHSQSPHFIDYAINIARSFKVGELVPDLIDLLKDKRNLNKTLSMKISIVEALAAIGDPSCLPIFKVLLLWRRLLFRDAHTMLKRKIYGTLASFDLDHIEDLVEMGLASEDEEIQALCKEIVEQHAAPNRSESRLNVDER